MHTYTLSEWRIMQKRKRRRRRIYHKWKCNCIGCTCAGSFVLCCMCVNVYVYCRLCYTCVLCLVYAVHLVHIIWYFICTIFVKWLQQYLLAAIWTSVYVLVQYLSRGWHSGIHKYTQITRWNGSLCRQIANENFVFSKRQNKIPDVMLTLSALGWAPLALAKILRR